MNFLWSSPLVITSVDVSTISVYYSQLNLSYSGMTKVSAFPPGRAKPL
jgi:hypothetical protein